MSSAAQAAGGVVVRRDGPEHKIALVHRPRYDDWSLPKGKLDPGESFEQAALREVAEETHCRCRLEAELSPSRYTDHKGRDKLVRWWRMDVLEAGTFTPNDEIDELRWCNIEEALRLLDYDDQKALVKKALAEGGEEGRG